MSQIKPEHSYAYQHNIHNHSDAYYARLAKKDPKLDVGALKTKQRAAYQAYLNTPMYKKDVKDGFYSASTLATYHQGEPAGTPSTAPSATGTKNSTGSSSSQRVASSQQTRDGYTVTQAVADITKLAKLNGSALPSAATVQAIAQGVIDGVNANFSGVNGIGNYAAVSGKTMAKTLIASAYQESRFDIAGQDAGGVLQTYITRLADYNAHAGTNYTQAALAGNVPLAMQVATWAMANPSKGMVGAQAGKDPIPSELSKQALYYWNYHPVAGHGHADELADYMQKTTQFVNQLG